MADVARAEPAILIAGAGPVGLTAALALHRAGHRVRVVDAKPADANPAGGSDDPRAIALSHGSRLLLERLDVWGQMVATPITHVHVSQQGGFGQTCIDANEHHVAALGHVTRLHTLTNVLLVAARQAGISVDFGISASALAQTPDQIEVSLTSASDQTHVRTPLLILAEGKPAGAAQRKEYQQTAIVTEAWSATPHDGHAFERFTPHGPLALLPLGDASSVVWCMEHARAAELMALHDADFLVQLNRATSFARRTWLRAATRAAFPLALVEAAQSPHPRVVALGNAAQTLHPVAGQGLNLGLRDAFELAERITHGVSLAALAQYRRQRRRDRFATIALTDGYVSLFSNRLAPLRVARGAGLTLLNLVPPLRRAVARRMMFGLR